MTTESYQVFINGIPIDVFRKDIKNMHLSVHPPSGRVRISAPVKANDESVRLFAISKLSWIKKHQKNFESQQRQSVREYVSGESHYFQGNRYLLNIVFQDGPGKVAIRNKKFIDLYVPKLSDLVYRDQVMTAWYRVQIKKEIPTLVEKWEEMIGEKVLDYRVKKMKTRWGSCNSDARRIWLNLELIKKPKHCLEYIIVHEMVHLIERHHNDAFVSLMDKYMPNWRLFKEELNHFPLDHADWTY